ncbi:MAG: hypothetical protein U0324_14265 [Polyangiales bacterium]
MEILETTSLGPVTRTNLDAWVTTYGLRVTSVIDPPAERVTRTFMTYGIRESLFVVDLRTMRIVNKYNGSVAGVGASSVSMATERILQLLRGM